MQARREKRKKAKSQAFMQAEGGWLAPQFMPKIQLLFLGLNLLCIRLITGNKQKRRGLVTAGRGTYGLQLRQRLVPFRRYCPSID